MSNNKIKTLKVGILGEPNTGKSTLFNTLMNKKYSIVTRKAQTTIKKNSAVLVKENKQIMELERECEGKCRKYVRN